MTEQHRYAVSNPPAAHDIDAAIDAVCDRVAPFWPLDAMVATNPYLGFVERPFAETAAYQMRILGRRMVMERAWFRSQWESGRIERRDLEEAVARTPGAPGVQTILAALDQPEPTPTPQLLYSHMLDERYRPGYSRYVVQQISQFCAGYYDRGQAIWSMPDFGNGLYEAWRNYTHLDRSPQGMEIRDVHGPLAELPDDARGTLRVVLERLQVPPERTEDFLYVALASIGGWAAFTRHLRWAAELDGGSNDDIVDLLAIRLAWELILVGNCDRPARTAQWRQSLHCWPERLRAPQARALSVDMVLLRAAELGYQRRVATGLTRPERTGVDDAPRPALQAAFCIDVRSEVFRRALETADPTVETQGFAGFFGVMADYRPLGGSEGRAHLPVLLSPRYRVCETAGDGNGASTAELLARRRLALGLRKGWKQFKLSSSSCFSFVESAGMWYAFKLVTDSLGWTRPVPHPETVGLGEDNARLQPDLDAGCSGGSGIPPGERPGVAAFILNAMGLKERFARLVLLVGHGSSSVNNPQRAGLDCGACAGQTGEASVRMAAALLNDPAVRAALADDGTTIPADTWFVPSLHDTTTDEVRLLDTNLLGPEWREDLAQAERLLARAGDITRLERLALLGGESHGPTEALAAVKRRSRDWSQVRPEWGLANNAAFIAAPRTRTRRLQLAGRAFLHEYDWRRDEGFSVLELIMTAPMVVANWINLQYYGSTVDPEHLGAGNKVLHNVVGGRIGVLEGNGGDLRVGLARQSLHDGRRWFHEPLRLSVFIEAPTQEMERVVAGNDMVRHLVGNEWLHLFRIADDGDVFRRVPEGGWEAFCPAEEGAPASAA